MVTEYQRASFYLDDIVTVSGYHLPGNTWNGFEQPLLPRDEAVRALQAFKDATEDSDSAVMLDSWEWDEADEILSIRWVCDDMPDVYDNLAPVVIDGQEHYPMGLGWVWALEEGDDDE